MFLCVPQFFTGQGKQGPHKLKSAWPLKHLVMW